MHFAPDEMQISPSPLQGPRKQSCSSILSSSGDANCILELSPAGAHPECWWVMEKPRRYHLWMGDHFKAPHLGVSSHFSLAFSHHGHRPLCFGAVPLEYSKTSHVLNREEGDKETPQASLSPAATGQELLHHPSWDEEDGASHSHGHPLSSLSPATYVTLHSHPRGVQTDLPTISTPEKSKGIPRKANPKSRLH